MGQLPAGRRDELIVESIDDELLVYDMRSGRAHSLNRVAARVWELCDGDRDPATIAEVAGVGEDAVWRALTQLDERRLLTGELPTRMSGPEYSRRQAVRRIGLIGASAAFAAPLVKSIVVPTPSQAQMASCVPLDGECGTSTGEGCDTSTFPPCCVSPGQFIGCFTVEGGGCLCQVSE